ncbi:hypothetical protein [Phenylobacterium sp.]|uniref:hypothetical protein n=1 Tax=Phenylobacterium sp. TaxID=1871053 RepID=UPI0012280BE6|nr:hypothetical protein [Phenylobacterium sp.]THD63549.1 MAG: hypothetical protein E8A49_05245 [Phenylobacterium sp.]
MTETSANPVISEEYRRLQQELHRNPNYGVASIQFAPVVKRLADQIGATSLSDYGAGKMHLDRTLRELGAVLDYRPYDPSFPEYGEPKPADLVCCIDVLEHIEPDYLDNVLDELRAITVAHGFFSIHTGPAQKHLADGRNAHLIQQPSSWWLPRLCERFEIDMLNKTPGGFFVVVSPRRPGGG